MRYLAVIAAFLFVLAGSVWATDKWDYATPNDDTAATTQNVLWHTAGPQTHDLQYNTTDGDDQDWFKIFPRQYRSYEVQMLNITGSVALAPTDFQRYNSTGTTVLQNGGSLDPSGRTMALRWVATANTEERIRVWGYSFNDYYSQYDIQLLETTLYCPRWNQAGTQTSVLILQRTGASIVAASCTGHAYFFDEGSVLLADYPFTMDTLNDVDVYSLAGISGLPTHKGGAMIAHDCGYGGIAAKLVALEPSTGFSFDTWCSWLPR